MKRKLGIILAMILVLCVCFSASAETNAEQYENALGLLKEEEYSEAGKAFAALGSYADSPRYVMYCSAIAQAEAGNYTTAITNLSNLGDFLDSSLLVTYYVGLSWESVGDYEKALEVLSGITLYKDVSERIASYPERKLGRDYLKADADEQAGRLEEALAGFKKLGNYKDSSDRAAAVQEKINESDYEKADKAEEHDELEDSLAGFKMLGNYKDSADRAKTVQAKIDERDAVAAEKAREDAYAAADKAEQNGDYAAAYDGFAALEDYKDSRDRAAAVQDRGTYAQAMVYALNGNYTKAFTLFSKLGDYEDAVEKAYVTGVTSFAAEVKDLGDGTAAFQFHGVWGIIDVNTNTTASPNWDSISSFNRYDLAMVEKDKHYGYINRQGAIVVPCKYYAVSDYDDSGICTVAELREEKNGKKVISYYDLGLYDKDGKTIIDPKYKTWQAVGNSYNIDWGGLYNRLRINSPDFIDGKIKAQNADGKWGFISISGGLIGRVRWDAIDDFSEGMAAVSENGKYGYIDQYGQVLIEPQYDSARVFCEGQAWVKASNGLWQSIDRENNIVIEAKYSKVTEFKNGLADVELPNIGWQIINSKGELEYFKTNAAEEPQDSMDGEASTAEEAEAEEEKTAKQPVIYGSYMVEKETDFSKIRVYVTVEYGTITKVKITSEEKSMGSNFLTEDISAIWARAIVENQTAETDAITGATLKYSAGAVREAIAEILEKIR